MAIIYLKTERDTANFKRQMQPVFDKIMKPVKKEKKTKALYSKKAKNERVKRCKDTIKKRKRADKSPAEEKIALFLMRNQVRFESERYFPGLFNDRTNNLLYFDFYLPDYNVVIEFDGLHHFKAVYGKKELDQQKHKDDRKNRFCRNRGIRLLRICCFDKRSIEDIITEFFDRYFP